MTEHKKSISVIEMGKILGMRKTNSYYLIRKNLFEVREVNGKMRVMVDSFEAWYAGQTWYKKVNESREGAENNGNHSEET